MLLTVHDELVFEVPAAGVPPNFMRWVKNEMETVYQLAVPLIVDVGGGCDLGGRALTATAAGNAPSLRTSCP